MHHMCNLGLFSLDRYVFKSAGRCAAVLTLSGSSDPFRVAVLKDRPGAHPNPLPSVSVPMSSDFGTQRRCKYIHSCVHAYVHIDKLYLQCHVPLCHAMQNYTVRHAFVFTSCNTIISIFL